MTSPRRRVHGRKPAEGSVAGPKNYVMESIGEFVDAGVGEIMFGELPAPEIEQYRRVDQEVLAAFD